MKIQVDFANQSFKNSQPKGASAAGTTFKLAILIWLTLQNSVNSLLLRYSRVRNVPEMYFSTVAVFWMEIIKLAICLAMIFRAEMHKGMLKLPQKYSKFIIFPSIFHLFKRQIVDQPKDTLKVCLPSILYILQNNLLYVAASHLNAATFMIASQLKIFTTAIFSIILLNRSLLRVQWISLFVLFVGVSLVQFKPENKNGKEKSQENYSNFVDEQDPLTGLFAIGFACTLSGFSGVYFEKILKNSSSVSLWMRNVQMSIFAIPASLIAIFMQDGSKISEHGFMFGWDWVVWLTASWVAIGGLSVAVCIKYANNIAKNFATSVAIILATIGSIKIFGFQPSFLFSAGAIMVIFSIFLYSSAENFRNCWSSLCGTKNKVQKYKILEQKKRTFG